jgi:hypothetical protein
MYNTIFIYKSQTSQHGKTYWKLENFAKSQKAWFKIKFIIWIGMNIAF